VIGMTELALDSNPDPEQRHYLDMVMASANSLLTVINDILDFSKIEAGMLDFDAIDFNIRDSLEETAQTLGPKAQGKGVELICDVRPDVPEYVRGDPTRLRQIVVNLVGNAIKFTTRGEIVLRVQTESETGEKFLLRFAVHDTGIGIPKDKQRVIFDAFSQADTSTTRKFGGTGLGLTISSRLVEMMGGKIWLESEEGRGSTFHFTAQFASPATLHQDLAPAFPKDLKGLSVLVVDDNQTNRCILNELLIDWGMKTTLADNAVTALEAIRQAAKTVEPFRIVLTDARMPVMDGFELAAQIQKDVELAGSTLTIMMLTSVGQRGDGARCRELGVAAYLTKPVRQTELRGAILRVLGDGREKGQQAPLVTRYSLRPLREERKGLRILLAEDNAVNQRLAKRLLEKRGHSVMIAENGREALAALDKDNFDIVLMDVQMPEMGGLEATAAIRESEKVTGAHIPIVAMTARAMAGDREQCLAAGMDDYVSKPVQTNQLLEVIERLVSLKPSK
jgi:two-component system sensor histidine kinase/response regulator